MTPDRADEFRSKGAVEQDRPEQQTNESLAGQIGHRNNSELVDTHDTDFPEPGGSPEHSGEAMDQKNKQEEEQHPKTEQDTDEVLEEVDQDPGERQRRNQNDQEEDPLAA